MLKGGYTGKILRVNLTDQSWLEETTDEQLAKEYLGGAGFGVKLLFDSISPYADPLGEENTIIFAPGPFTGTPVPSASRMAVTALSPLTGAVGMALSGGHFPAELKFAGYDALVIKGKAEKPVYLWINDGKISFRSAEELWGTRTFDCQQMIKDQLGDQNIKVACIGPAGENISKIACIINEKRAIGRKGLGAVMGSKNLKAIAVKGSGKLAIADEETFKQARLQMAKAMKESPMLYSTFAHTGTPVVVDVAGELGILAAKNWSATGQWVPVEELGVESNTKRKISREHCHNCPVGCSQIKVARGGSYQGILSEGPEFESIYSFGTQTGVDNLDAIIVADRICDELGMDSISAGVTVGFAMELFEKGIISETDTGGMNLNFGDDKAMLELFQQMAYRQGFGDVLADGTRQAAVKIGKGSEKYAMHVKGLEMPAYDIRGAKAHGLNYATAFTGADHCRGYAFQEIFGIPIPVAVDRFAIEGKGKLTKWNQDIRTSTCDCATMCGFILDMAVAGIATKNTADLFTSLVGVKISENDVETVGERVNNLARVINTLQGLTRNDDTFPERILTEPLKEGNSKGEYISKEDLDRMLDEYYQARSWTLEGVPTKEKLLTLNLGEAIKALDEFKEEQDSHDQCDSKRSS